MSNGQYPHQGGPPQQPGQFPPGQHPPGQHPPGQYPPGQYPPGAYPPGPYPYRPYPPQKSGLGWLVILIIVGAVGVPVLGIMAAVAIPAFIKYKRMSKTVEATESLDKIKAGARMYFVTDHWDENGNLLPKGFPTNIVKTPTNPGCDKQVTPTSTWDTNGWGPLHFALTEPHYYSYEFVSTGTGTSSVYTARAHGDLDCDGTQSTFELRGSIDNEGSVRVVGPIIYSEIE